MFDAEMIHSSPVSISSVIIADHPKIIALPIPYCSSQIDQFHFAGTLNSLEQPRS